MTRARWIVLLGAFGAVACNAILDNTPGELSATDSSGTDPVADSSAPLPEVPKIENDAAVNGPCAADEHSCQGVCVKVNDPLFGCGATSCAPCATPHGSATCMGNACAVAQCDRGYADCNHSAVDGCEIDLSLPTSCGSCNGRCAAAAPVCAPSGTSFGCSSGCPATAPVLCGAQCVDLLTSPTHCGGCNTVCNVDHATSDCVASHCTFTCAAGYHACGAKCALTTDVTACGPGCMVCPGGANADPTCAQDACGLKCKPGFADCNLSAADGCESELARDPLNCGQCGTSCNGGTCRNGVCQPDAGPP